MEDDKKRAARPIKVYPDGPAAPEEALLVPLQPTGQATALSLFSVLYQEDPELLLSMKPFEMRIFEWLCDSVENARQMVIDPVGCLKKIGLELEESCWDRLIKACEMVRRLEEEQGMP